MFLKSWQQLETDGVITLCSILLNTLRLNDSMRWRFSVKTLSVNVKQNKPDLLQSEVWVSHCWGQNGSLKVSLQDVRMSQNSTKSLCMKFWLWIRSSSEGKYCMLSSCRRRLSSCRRRPSSCSTMICPGGVVEPCGLGLSKRAPLAFSRTPRYESMSVSSMSLSELLPLSLPTESERMCSIWYFSCIKNWLVFLGARIPLALFPLTLTGRRDITGLLSLRGWW